MAFHEDANATAIRDIYAESVGYSDDEQEVRARDDRAVLEHYGYDVDTTPVDTLMAGNAGFDVAWAMEHGDEPYDT